MHRTQLIVNPRTPPPPPPTAPPDPHLLLFYHIHTIMPSPSSPRSPIPHEPKCENRTHHPPTPLPPFPSLGGFTASHPIATPLALPFTDPFVAAPPEPTAVVTISASRQLLAKLPTFLCQPSTAPSIAKPKRATRRPAHPPVSRPGSMRRPVRRSSRSASQPSVARTPQSDDSDFE